MTGSVLHSAWYNPASASRKAIIISWCTQPRAVRTLEHNHSMLYTLWQNFILNHREWTSPISQANTNGWGRQERCGGSRWV